MKGIYLGKYIFLSNKMKPHHPHLLFLAVISLLLTVSPKRLKMLNAVHSFRHGCAVNRLHLGESLTDIKNRLGHENFQSTMTYLKLDISHKRQIQKKSTEHTQPPLKFDPKLEEALDWENREKTLAWLDSL